MNTKFNIGDVFTDINSNKPNETFTVSRTDWKGVYDEHGWYRLNKNCKQEITKQEGIMDEHFTKVGTRATPPKVMRAVANVVEAIPEDAEDRMCIEQFDENGTLVVRSYGPNPQERQKAHDNHTCGMFCDICYDEAMRLTCAKDPETCNSIPPGSCSQDCHGFKSIHDDHIEGEERALSK